jgi:type I restriction enzyme M protein
LVEEGLYAVVSLPSGVFNPYAGVKTSILFFDNDRAKQQKEILFAKISKEGYDLGAQRRPLCSENGDKPEWCPKHSDFPEVLEVLNKWKNGEKVDSSQSVYVEKTRIAESGEYDLSSDHYRIVADYTKAKWPMAELGQVVEILDYRRKPITKSDRTSGQFPYYGATEF